ncbi:MAG: hypothetical protein M0R17_05910 [Candidatus Omnitrophica bacterium]|jgi:hypothetical protein|nr:hypothetical protein [Candidatus Omnitrophota bacterium]
MESVTLAGIIGFILFGLFFSLIMIGGFISLELSKEICEENNMSYNYNGGCVKEVGNSVEIYKIENKDGMFDFKLNKYPSIPN